jgi:hypothetical protein
MLPQPLLPCRRSPALPVPALILNPPPLPPRPPPAANLAEAALNQLELLDPSDAWLDAAHPLLADAAPAPPAPPAPVDGGDEDASGAGGGSIFAARRARARRGGAAPGGVVTLPALRREAALFSAAAGLADCLPGLDVLRLPAPGEDYVFDQLLAAGRLGEAEALAHAVWAAGELEERLEWLAAAAAARCARAQAGLAAGAGGAAGEGGGGGASASAAVGADDALWDDGGAAWGGDGGSTGGGGGALGYLGSLAAGGWQRLRRLLERYEAAGRRRLAGRLRVAAADAALAEAPGGALPAWLVAPFAPGAAAAAGGMAGGPDDPAALLRVYARHGRLADAAELALAHLAAWQAAGPLARCKPAADWMPLRQLEALDAALAAAAEGLGGGGGAAGPRLAGLQSRLRAAVSEHLALGDRDTKLAAAGGGGGGATGMALG